MQPKAIKVPDEDATSKVSIPSSPRPATRRSPNVTSSSTSGPRLARSISASSRIAVRTLSINPRSPRKFEVKRILKDGNSDEMEGSAMSTSAIIKTLNSGTEDQITLALFETQQVLEACREYAVLSLVPVICKKFVQWDPAIQVSAAETLLVVVSSKIPAHVAKIIYDTTLQVIRTSSDPCVSEMCGQTLVRTLPHVSWTPKELDEIVDQLETRRASMDGRQRLAVSRKLTARILGSLAMCSKREDLKKRIMYRAMFLANDEDLEVRGMVAESLSFIGASIHVSVVEDELWPCVSKLIRDKNARVHAASMRTLSFIAAAHASHSPTSLLYRHLIPPIFIKECARIRRAAEADQRTVDDDTYLVLEINSEIFGELLNSCWNYMPEDTRRDAFKAFLAMSTCNGPIVRKYCAYNLPGVSKCFLERRRVEMSNIVEFLSKDAEPETRYVLASGIHQTVKILAGQDTISNLFKAVLALLQDENPLVRLSTLKYFEDLIALLSKHMGYNSVRKLEPIFQNLQLLSEGNWRTQELLSNQLLMAAPLVPSPSIRSNVLPLLYKLAERSSYLVRKAAMAAVATCMRYIPDIVEREKAMASFRTEWANGSIYWMRIGFIDSAKAALDSYSRCLFRDTFASEVLRLADDRVPNVRVRVALILPLITCACHQMVEFKTTLNKLKTDGDKDVQDALQEIDVRIAESLEKGQERFEEDMKREEEEQDLYSKHLNEKKEAFRKKKGNIKRAKTMFMKRSVKALPSSSSKNTAQANNEKNKENSAANNHSDSQQMFSGSQTPRGQLLGRRSLNLERKDLSMTWIRARSNSGARNIDKPTAAENTEFVGAGSPSSSLSNTEPSPQRKALPKRSRSFVLKRS